MRKKRTLKGKIRTMIRISKALLEASPTKAIPIPPGYWEVIQGLRKLAYKRGWRTRMDKKKGLLWFYGPHYPGENYGRRFHISIPREGEDYMWPSDVSALKFTYEEVIAGEAR